MDENDDLFDEDYSIQFENVPYPFGIGNPGWDDEEAAPES